jgi:hypothetical protein
MECPAPDMPVEPPNPGRYASDMEGRVAVLEQIARSTTAALERIEHRMDTQPADTRALSAEHRADSRWPLGVMLAGFSTSPGAMAHGFHWL